MIRLFTAIPFSEEVQARLAALGGGVPGARWVEARNLHLTLRFIGEVPEPQAGDIAGCLDRVRAPRFDLVLEGVGRFGNDRRGGALWVGVRPCEALHHLHAKVERALVESGLPPEGRRFTPHVTLARLKSPDRRRLADFLAAHAPFRHGPIAVDRFVLYSSRLGRGGAVYTPERSYPLDPARDGGPEAIT